MAMLRLQRGYYKETQGLQVIHDELAEAFRLSVKLQRPDYIASVGAMLAQTLALGGQHDEALQVLDAAEQGFRTLSNDAGVQQIEQLRQAIRASGGQGPELGVVTPALEGACAVNPPPSRQWAGVICEGARLCEHDEWIGGWGRWAREGALALTPRRSSPDS